MPFDDQEEYETVSAEEFADLLARREAGDAEALAATIVDLREPDELVVFDIEGAINIPFAQVGQGLDRVPAGAPVYVVCRTGDWSAEVAELLTDRGYEAYNVAGGTQALRKVLAGETDEPAAAAPVPTAAPAPETPADEPVYVDARGLRCPGPIVKVADTLRGLKEGQTVYVEATEDAFASDVAVWAERTGNRLESLEVQPDVIKATLRKGAASPASLSLIHI